MHSFDYCLIRHAKKEAKKVGANCIKITDREFVGKVFLRDAITLKMYKLNEPYFSVYKNYKDSTNNIEKKKNEKFAIVNLTSLDGNYNIYYNDSLVCQSLKPTKEKGKYIFHPQQIKFEKSGLLSLHINGTNKYKPGMVLEIGHSYSYAITTAGSKHGPYFTEIKKEDY
jgi:hypothetical protein